MDKTSVMIWAFFSLFLLLISFEEALLTDPGAANDSGFDFLIFAQVWPMTQCITWKEESERNTCNLQSKPSWSVHGIWPTKNGQRGPYKCNDSLPFRPEEIQSIIPDLETRWIDVHANDDEKYGFWKHEWEKHGTCAVQLEALDTELKYFSEGLKWNEEYPITDYFAKAGIVPGKHYSADEFLNAVKSEINGTQPAIECVYDQSQRRHSLQQVNICFDKDLNLINCTHVAGGTKINCPPEHEEIFYPQDSGFEPSKPNYLAFGIAMSIIIGGSALSLAAYLVVKKVRNFSAQRGYEAI